MPTFRALFRWTDRILLGVALILFALTAYWSLRQFARIDEISAGESLVGAPLNAYEPDPATPLRIVTQTWEKAPSQSSGPEWVYDVFTPPFIYYNPVTLQFTVSPPEFERPVEFKQDSFELELLEVRPQPFRLQLVGYVGRDGDYLATFESVTTGQTMTGRPGTRFDSIGVTVRSFELRREAIPSGSGSPVFDTVAVAVVYDEETGEDRVLTDKAKAMLPGPEAVFRISANPIIEYLLKEGAEISSGSQTYRIDALVISPAQATVTLIEADGNEPTTRTISPVPRYINSPQIERR
ncbi:MAG: hypothetical protein R3F07_17620 [Opitutaceae bacterium]